MTSPLIKDKVALITGASRGIGAAMARLMAQNGAKLLLTATDEEKLNELADELRSKYGTTCLVSAGDVTDTSFVQSQYKTIHKEFGRLDILSANAGILQDGLLGMVSDADLQKILDVNVKGVFHHVQFAARLMRRKKAGSMILTSSIIGRVGNKGQAAYAASKAAVLGLMQSSAKELGADNIRVNAIAPGFIETDMTKHLSDDIRKERIANIALNRTGSPEDVAKVALFLASDLSSYVSGQVIGVDGCMVI